MRRVRVLLAWLLVMSGASGVAVASKATPFPASVYPRPVHSAAGAAFSACPNPSGLEPFNAATKKLAEQVAMRYGHASLAGDLTRSDRSFWPMLRGYWRSTKHSSWLSELDVVRGARLGANIGWSEVVRHYCGPKLLTDSLELIATARHLNNCNDCNGAGELFIDRRGVPLLYMVH
jgi:hypothetical protein